MSVKIMARVWANSGRRGGELLVQLALADFANDRGECWPSIPTLAAKARLSVRQTRRALASFEEAGELRRQAGGGRGRSSYYIICDTRKRGQGDTVLTAERVTSATKKGDICDRKGDICDQETLSPSEGRWNANRHRTVIEPSRTIKKKGATVKKKGAEDFDRFYEAYPRHVGKAEAWKAWTRLSPTPDLVAEIMTGVGRYAQSVAGFEQRYIKHPASWLNGRRWEDEPVRKKRHDYEAGAFPPL